MATGLQHSPRQNNMLQVTTQLLSLNKYDVSVCKTIAVIAQNIKHKKKEKKITI
jgi:hypothetical protein